MPLAHNLHATDLCTLRLGTRAALALVTLIALVATGCGGTAPGPTGAWVQTWADEFEGGAGQRPDPTKWGAEVGGSGFGNNEQEYYTDSAANASLDGKGNLAIVARKESQGGRSYTSARLVTKGRLEQKYGKFEARIQLPTGRGIWPAFWMLGANGDTNAWPACGEIDIMEQRGQEPLINHGSLHGPGYSGGAAISRAYPLPGPRSFHDDFHVFTVEWDPAQIVFSVDGDQYQIVKASALPASSPWVYDHPFFLILNIAVGGDYVGSPSAATAFPQTMLVDWVRAYQRAP